jgi:hypothetical protein
MEDLRDLMAELDTISKSIPEGNYLKMCDLMKGLHDGTSCCATRGKYSRDGSYLP